MLILAAYATYKCQDFIVIQCHSASWRSTLYLGELLNCRLAWQAVYTVIPCIVDVVIGTVQWRVT